VSYFSILGCLNISGRAKAKNLPKLSMGMTGISAQSLHRCPGAESIVGLGARSGMGKFGALPPETKHLHTCQSILLAILLKNFLKMVKNQSACYILTHRHLPHPPLYQPEASCGNLVPSRL